MTPDPVDRPGRAGGFRGSSGRSRLGWWGLGLALAGTTLATVSVWMALESITLSSDPLGAAPRWLAAVAGGGLMLVASAGIAVGALAFGRGRLAAVLTLVTVLVAAPLLTVMSASLGVDGLKERTRTAVESGSGQGIDRVVRAWGELGLPEAPIHTLLGQDSGTPSDVR